MKHARGAAQEGLGQLVAMGFPAAAAAQALRQCGNNTDDALEWLLSPEGQVATEVAQVAATIDADCGAGAPPPRPAAASSGPSPPSTASGPSAAASSAAGREEEVSECAICCEDLRMADAAMRCTGDGGRRRQHYFHAHCLSSWVRECQRTNSEATCPECRGPVQVRGRRLREFLEDKGGSMEREDRDALRQFGDTAADADDDGWSDIKRDVLMGAAIVGVGVGLAMAVFAGLSALNKDSSGRTTRLRSDASSILGERGGKYPILCAKVREGGS